jgi:hypothetical protein
MIEYLYVDSRRLDNYFEQISSPVVFDKVPTWSVELSLIGPKAGGTQTRQGRAPTSQEKIERFVDYIRSNNLTTPERPSFFKNPLLNQRLEKLFVIETLIARRVSIKYNDENLNMWVSIPSPQEVVDDVQGNYHIGALYLIEDFRGDESNYQTFSGYSSLYLLAGQLVSSNIPMIANDVIGNLRKQDDATRLFAVDPLGTLESLGGKIGPERHIATVYRYRASCIEMEGEQRRAVTTIGYPIFVRESTSD